MQNLTDQYRREFYLESREIIEQINKEALQLENEPDNQALINSIFRGMHTIKGSAGMFELHDISKFAHHLEGFFNSLRSGRIKLLPEMVDVILDGTDQIIVMIEAYEKGERVEASRELIERIASYSGLEQPVTASDKGITSKSGKDGSSTPTVVSAGKLNLGRIGLTAETSARFEEAYAGGLHVFRITLNYSSDLLVHGYDPLALLRNVKKMSELYHTAALVDPVPTLNEFDPMTLYLNPSLVVATPIDEKTLLDLSFDPSLMEITDLSIQAGDGTIAGMTHKEAMREFLEGAAVWTESMEQAAISFENSGDDKALNEIFRVAHNIKGDADFIGIKELALFAHAFENMLAQLRDGRIKRTAGRVDIILQSVDYIRRCFNGLASGVCPSHPPELLQALSEFEAAAPAEEKRTCQGDMLPETRPELRDVFAEQLMQYRQILQSATRDHVMTDDQKRTIRRAFQGVLNASRSAGHATLRQLAESGMAIPENAVDSASEDAIRGAAAKIEAYISGLEKGPKRLGEILVADGKITEKDLTEILERQKPIGAMLVEAGKVSSTDVEQAIEKQELMETAGQIEQAATSATGARTMRVDEQKVEQFTNTIGEMLIARNTYAYLLDRIEGYGGEIRDTVKALKENLHLFSRLTNDVQHGVMALRMVPIRNIFQKFNRVVRDISRKQKKFIQLITDGEEIEIDKKVTDMLSEPMVHLVRNACDHGVESPAERKKAGKNEKATILLRASREGSNLCIRIIDDGQGIDRQKLFEKAQQKGLPIKSPEDPAIFDLIFLPGLSTSEEVTDISGRGVGMDVVKTTVQSLGGTVGVESQEGQGTQITLMLPTSLGIDTVLFIESSGEAYALPINHIVETLKVPQDRIRRAGDRLLFHHRGEVLGVHHLSDMLESASAVGSDCLRGNNDAGEELSMVVVRSGNRKYGMIVDRLDRNMEIAIKPVPDSLGDIDIISGVSIMGDGKVMLVLNPDNL